MDFGARAAGLGQLNAVKKRRQDESPGREGLESTSEGAKKTKQKTNSFCYCNLPPGRGTTMQHFTVHS